MNKIGPGQSSKTKQVTTSSITGTEGTRHHVVRGGQSSPLIMWSPIFLFGIGLCLCYWSRPLIFGMNLGTIIHTYIYTHISRPHSRSKILWITVLTGSVGRDRHVASSTISESQIKTSAIAANLPPLSFCVACELDVSAQRVFPSVELVFPLCSLISCRHKAKLCDAYSIN